MWGETAAGVADNTAEIRISIHSPRVGRDGVELAVGAEVVLFQSTRPVWGETGLISDVLHRRLFQSTRPVWGETALAEGKNPKRLISIHSPRVGRDSSRQVSRGTNPIFQSTRPVWGETQAAERSAEGVMDFNPLAPCGARRLYDGVMRKLQDYFNPLAPCGARRQSCTRQSSHLAQFCTSNRSILPRREYTHETAG